MLWTGRPPIGCYKCLPNWPPETPASDGLLTTKSGSRGAEPVEIRHLPIGCLQSRMGFKGSAGDQMGDQMEPGGKRMPLGGGGNRQADAQTRVDSSRCQFSDPQRADSGSGESWFEPRRGN